MNTARNNFWLPRYLLNILSSVCLPTRGFTLKRWFYRQSGVVLGSNVCLTSELKIYGNGRLNLGDNTWVGIGTEFLIPAHTKISIGNNCDIAPRVRFMCGSHEIGLGTKRAGPGASRGIDVGNGVWIGTGAILMPGVRIGDGTIIGAGSIVLGGEYQPNILLAGNPATVKKKYND